MPWKYGFKSIKSIVKIEFVKERPTSLWEHLASGEYGFLRERESQGRSPALDQASERVIDGRLFRNASRPHFNGYESYVAKLYAGLDLKTNY